MILKNVPKSDPMFQGKKVVNLQYVISHVP